MARRFGYLFLAIFIAIVIEIGGEQTIKAYFTNPYLTTYPVSWPLMLAGFILLMLSWVACNDIKISFSLVSAFAGFAALVIAIPVACSAGFCGFASLAFLLLPKPFSDGYAMRNKPVPVFTKITQGFYLGGSVAFMASAIIIGILPAPR